MLAVTFYSPNRPLMMRSAKTRFSVMTRRQIILVTGVGTPLVGVLVGLVSGLASSEQHWPGWLEFLRTHPWQSLGALTVIAVALATLATARPSKQLSLRAAADRLARAVHRDWSYEAQWRRVFDPYPLPVRWHPAAPDLIAPWATILKLAQAGPGPSSASTEWATGPTALFGADNDLADVLRRIPTGRLVVLGAKGTGKTILLVRLLLDLLSRRERGQPVPILLPLASWNPVDEDLNSWIVRWLITDRAGMGGYVQTGSRVSLARALLDEGMIMPVLDGLDEIPAEVRGAAIARINDAIRPGQRLVLAARTGDYWQAVHSPHGQGVLLTGAAGIELEPLAQQVVTDYLRDSAGTPEAARRWQPVIAAFARAPTSPAARVLTTPLMASLSRVVYNPRPGENLADIPIDPVELLDRKRFPNRQSVEDYLFERFIPASYRLHPDPLHPSRDYKWTADQAQCWLAFIAKNLEDHQAGSTDIAWWRLRSAVPDHIQAITLAIVLGIVSGFAFPFAGLGFGLILGLSAGLVVRKLRPLDRDGLARGFLGALLGAITGALIGLAVLGVGPRDYTLGSVLGASMAVGVAAGCMRQLAAALTAGFVGEMVIAFYENAGQFYAIRNAVGVWSHIPNGIGIGLAAILYVELSNRTVPARGIRWSPAWFGCGLITAIVLGFVAWIQQGWLAGLAVALAATVASALVGGVAEPVATDLTGAANPETVLRRDRVTFAASGLGVGLALGTITGVSQALARNVSGIQNGWAFGLRVGIATFISVGLTCGSIQALWASFAVSRVILARRGYIPWRLMTFLRDAHANRGVLRQVGAVYQFRHVELQRRLAKPSRR
jgi:hypothetical protein